jgi:hypothetical protein
MAAIDSVDGIGGLLHVLGDVKCVDQPHHVARSVCRKTRFDGSERAPLWLGLGAVVNAPTSGVRGSTVGRLRSSHWSKSEGSGPRASRDAPSCPASACEELSDDGYRLETVRETVRDAPHLRTEHPHRHLPTEAVEQRLHEDAERPFGQTIPEGLVAERPSLLRIERAQNVGASS